MNRRSSTLRRILVLAAFLVGVFPTLPAQIVGQIEADIPFSFVVADKTLAPGSYVMRPVGDLDPGLEIRRADGGEPVVALVTRSVGGSLPARTELVFRRYDEQRFLSIVMVEGNHEKAEIEPSRKEKALKREGRMPHVETVTAKHRPGATDQS